MSDLTLHQDNNEGTFDVKIGDKITIDLQESPTGYRWDIDEAGKAIVKFEGTSFAGSEGSGVGGAGRRTFTFSAVKKGSDTISLKHWRAWDGESSVNKRFTVKINART